MATRESRGALVLIALLAVGAVVGGGVWWWTGPHARDEARRTTREAIGRYLGCLLGPEAPMGPAGVSARVRAIAVRMTVEGVEEDPWPGGCAVHLDAARGALAELESPAAAALAEALPEVMALDLASLWSSGPEEGAYAALTTMLERADAAQLLGAPVGGEFAPGPGAELLAHPPTVGHGPSPEIDERAGAPTMLVASEEGPLLTCAVDGAPDAPLSCVAAAVDAGARPTSVPRQAGAPVVLRLGPSGPGARLVAADGTPRGEAVRLSYVAADGAIVGFEIREGWSPPIAVRRPSEGAETSAEIAPPRDNVMPTDAIVDPGVAAVQWGAPGKGSILTVYRIGDDGSFGEPVQLDLLPEGSRESPPRMRAVCALTGAVGVVWAAEGETPMRVEVVRDGQRASHEVRPSVAGVPRIRCLDERVSFFFVESEPGEAARITALRCGFDGCEEETAAIERRAPFADAAVAALDYGERVLVALAGDGEPVVTLSAPLAELARATPRAILDVPRWGGVPARSHGLIHRGDGALLWISDSEQVRLVGLAADGSARAVTAEVEGDAAPPRD